MNPHSTREQAAWARCRERNERARHEHERLVREADERLAAEYEAAYQECVQACGDAPHE